MEAGSLLENVCNLPGVRFHSEPNCQRISLLYFFTCVVLVYLLPVGGMVYIRFNEKQNVLSVKVKNCHDL